MMWVRFLMGLALLFVAFTAGLLVARFSLGLWVAALLMGAVSATYARILQPPIPRKEPRHEC